MDSTRRCRCGRQLFCPDSLKMGTCVVCRGVYHEKMVWSNNGQVAPDSPSGADTPFHREAGKPRMDLLQWGALREVGRVAEFGAKKYGQRNWETYARDWRWGQLIASAVRHIGDWMMGEDDDPESGYSHIAHAAWNLLTLLELTLRALGTDDRTAVLTKELIHE